MGLVTTVLTTPIEVEGGFPARVAEITTSAAVRSVNPKVLGRIWRIAHLWYEVGAPNNCWATEWAPGDKIALKAVILVLPLHELHGRGDHPHEILSGPICGEVWKKAPGPSLRDEQRLLLFGKEVRCLNDTNWRHHRGKHVRGNIVLMFRQILVQAFNNCVVETVDCTERG
jgi:hypothetical protein